MNDWIALRSVPVILAVFGLAMFALWGLVATDHADLVIPSPEGTADQFVQALIAHRYEAARDLLSETVRAQVDEEELRDLTIALERATGGIDEAHEVAGRDDQDVARATVLLDLSNGKQQIIEFALRKEYGVWKITSFDGLRQLSGR